MTKKIHIAGLAPILHALDEAKSDIDHAFREAVKSFDALADKRALGGSLEIPTVEEIEIAMKTSSTATFKFRAQAVHDMLTSRLEPVPVWATLAATASRPSASELLVFEVLDPNQPHGRAKIAPSMAEALLRRFDIRHKPTRADEAEAARNDAVSPRGQPDMSPGDMLVRCNAAIIQLAANLVERRINCESGPMGIVGSATSEIDKLRATIDILRPAQAEASSLRARVAELEAQANTDGAVIHDLKGDVKAAEEARESGRRHAEANRIEYQRIVDRAQTAAEDWKARALWTERTPGLLPADYPDRLAKMIRENLPFEIKDAAHAGHPNRRWDVAQALATLVIDNLRHLGAENKPAELSPTLDRQWIGGFVEEAAAVVCRETAASHQGAFMALFEFVQAQARAGRVKVMAPTRSRADG